jgi:hypothetical protein
MANRSNLVVPIWQGADAHAKAETDRKTALFAWGDGILQRLGYTAKIKQATGLTALNKIEFDSEDIDVITAVSDALETPRAEHFAGMKAGTLKRLLKKRFDDQKKDRQAELLTGRASGPAGTPGQQNNAWVNELKLHPKTGAILPILKNFILFLCNHPDWKGVLGFNEFATQVVIKRRPYWGNVGPDTPWTDHFDSLARIWFQTQDITAVPGEVGRAIQVAARENSFHPVRDYLLNLAWDGQSRIDRWLITYLHAPDTPYVQAIAPRILISAVARIFDPGCKVENTNSGR